MTFRHSVRPAADLELQHALDYYALNAPHQVIELEAAIDEVFQRVTDNPTLLRERVRDLRCAFVSGFPYQP